MTDEGARRVDGLLASYGELTQRVATIEERTKSTNRSLDKAMVDFAAMLSRFDRECESKVRRLEEDIDSLGDKMDEQARSRAWTLSAKLTLFAALFAPLLSALLVVLSRGGA